MPCKKVTESRVNFSGLLTHDEVEQLQLDPDLDTLQFDEPVDSRNWPRLHAGLFSLRPEVALRAYGHYQNNCDLSFLEELPSLQRFAADCLTSATGLDALRHLVDLKELSVGIYELMDFEFLGAVSDGIEILSLGETRSRRPRLDALPRFRKLRDLHVDGHTKGLSHAAKLPLLEKLRCRRLRAPDLSFLDEVRRLWWLELVLGSTTDLSAIAGLKNLKHLEICWVRGLEDLRFLSRCANLQRLIIDRLKQVRQLPDTRPLRKLRALSLRSLKSLESVDPIGETAGLEWFGFVDASNFQPEDFRRALQAPMLKRATVGFGSDKRNRLFEQIAAEYGIDTRMEAGAYGGFEFGA